MEDHLGGNGPSLHDAIYEWTDAVDEKTGDCTIAGLGIAHHASFLDAIMATEYVYLTRLGARFMTDQRSGEDVQMTFDPVSIEALQ